MITRVVFGEETGVSPEIPVARPRYRASAPVAFVTWPRPSHTKRRWGRRKIVFTMQPLTVPRGVVHVKPFVCATCGAWLRGVSQHGLAFRLTVPVMVSVPGP